MSSSPLSLTSHFRRFPHLPPELCTRVWSFAIFSPRTLNISYIPTGLLDTEYIIAKEPTPAILHASHESRTEALVFYTKAFLATHSQRYVWINFHVDSIKINHDCFFYVSSKDRVRIQWLTIEVDAAGFFIHDFYSGTWKNMSKLKRLTILSTVEVSQWSHNFWLKSRDFGLWFVGAEVQGWMCPEITIVEKDTGFVMNLQNYHIFKGVGIRGSLRKGLANGESIVGEGRDVLLEYARVCGIRLTELNEKPRAETYRTPVNSTTGHSFPPPPFSSGMPPPFPPDMPPLSLAPPQSFAPSFPPGRQPGFPPAPPPGFQTG